MSESQGGHDDRILRQLKPSGLCALLDRLVLAVKKDPARPSGTGKSPWEIITDKIAKAWEDGSVDEIDEIPGLLKSLDEADVEEQEEYLEEPEADDDGPESPGERSERLSGLTAPADFAAGEVLQWYLGPGAPPVLLLPGERIVDRKDTDNEPLNSHLWQDAALKVCQESRGWKLQELDQRASEVGRLAVAMAKAARDEEAA